VLIYIFNGAKDVVDSGKDISSSGAKMARFHNLTDHSMETYSKAL
jgi:hypothetical protein